MRKFFPLGFYLFGSVPYCQPKSEEIYSSTLKSLFTVIVVDRETSIPKAYFSGFFLTEDGLGITSGPLIKIFQGNSFKVKLADLTELPAEIAYKDSVPGIGFIQVDTPKSFKIKLSKKECVEGESLYVFGIKEKDSYFNDVFITDTDYNCIKIKDEEISDISVIRTTGILPNECIGGPLVDLDGNATALVFAIHGGLAVAYSLQKLKKLYEKNNDWKIFIFFKSLIRKFYVY